MKRTLRSRLVLNQPMIVVIVLFVLAVTLLMSFLLQSRAESGALTPITAGSATAREQREIDKLNAEIKQIRSDPAAALLERWPFFVTLERLSAAILGQAKVTKDRLDLSTATVDKTYHAILQSCRRDACSCGRVGAELGKLLHHRPSSGASAMRAPELSH